MKRRKLTETEMSLVPSITHASTFATLGRKYNGEDGDFFIYRKTRLDFKPPPLPTGTMKGFRLTTLLEYDRLKSEIISATGDHYRENSQPFNSFDVLTNKGRRFKLDQHDQGNVRAIVSFSQPGVGGVLVFPEYDIMFPMPNQSILIYKSNNLITGVTPGSGNRSLITLFAAHGKNQSKKATGNNGSNSGPYLVR